MEMLTVDQLAEKLGIGRKTAYELVNQPDFFPAFRVGRRIIISVELLTEWMRQKSNVA